MTPIKNLVIIFLRLFGFSAAAGAQSNEWEALNSEAALLYQKGQYDKATAVAKKSLAVAEKTFGPKHPNMALSLNNLAARYSDQGQYAQAEPLFKQSLSIREKTLGPDHPDVAQSLNNLAALYRLQGTRSGRAAL